MQSQFYRFQTEYPTCIENVDWNFYGIAKDKSFVDFGTYLTTMKSMGLGFKILEPSVYGIENVEGLVSCKEMVFKREEPRKLFEKALEGHIEYNSKINAEDVIIEEDKVSINGKDYDWVINCTYNHLILTEETRDVIYELCLMLVYEDIDSSKPPLALTIMDGDLCSMYPLRSSEYDESKAYVSLSSVKHTPLIKCKTVEELMKFENELDIDKILQEKRPFFEQEISKFFPVFKKRYKFVTSYFSYKTKPNDNSDTRECFVDNVGKVINIWSGKINSIFDAEEKVGKIIGSPMKQFLGNKAALIGYTGFVGSNLNRQAEFHNFYNSKNLHKIKDQHFDAVFCAGAPAVKWMANKFPERDDASINGIIENLEAIGSAKLFVLISTIDVYPTLTKHAEDFPCESGDNHTYGRNRLRLEKFVLEQFPNCLIVRLPAMFGEGMKKNYIYDLINNNRISFIDPNSKFQWYSTSDLMSDITTVLSRNEHLSNPVRVVNFFPEPIHTSVIIDTLFKSQSPFTKPRSHQLNGLYDLRTLYGEMFSSISKPGYMRSADEIMQRLKDYVEGDYK